MHIYKLSILVISFNHEKYIHRAMRSIIDQKIEGPIELIIADDGSSDQTREIIRSYDGIDSRFNFKYLDHFPNLGITKNYQRGFAACSGMYVAVMEGDDFWSSPFKLQRQCDFLDAQWQCDLCSVNYYVYEEKRHTFTARTPAGNGHRFLGARELIADNLVGNFSTCMYRKAALERLPAGLFEIKSYDWIVNICIGTRSLIGFIEEPMSVYRLHEGGVWTQSSEIEKIKIQLEVLPAYDQVTDYVFSNEFAELNYRLKKMINAVDVDPLTKNVAKSFLKKTIYIKFVLPPIVLLIINLVMPPIIKKLISKIFNKG